METDGRKETRDAFERKLRLGVGENKKGQGLEGCFAVSLLDISSDPMTDGYDD